MWVCRIEIDILEACDSGEDEDCVETGFDARNDIRVHSVAYHSCLRRMDAEHLESRAHHERIGLTGEIRLLARRHLYRRYERAARGDYAVLDRTREIGIRADELRAVSDKVRSMDDRLIVIARSLADYDIIRVDAVHCDALIVERVDESGAPITYAEQPGF